jgi:ABC-type transporter Mla subunit MlaD
MSRRANRFKLGLFVIFSIVIFMGGILWIGVARFLAKTQPYVTFFNESVGGLNPGAEVDYLGLRIGHVSSIGLAPDGRLVRVVLQLRPDFKVTDSMSVQLQMKGITGQKLLAISETPSGAKMVTPKLPFKTKYPVIPARRGQFARIIDGLQKALKQVEGLDLQGLIAQWQQTGRDAKELVSSDAIRQTLQNVQAASADLEKILGGIGQPWTPEQWQTLFENLMKTVAAAREAGTTLAAQLQGISPRALSEIVKQTKETTATGEETVKELHDSLGETLELVQQTVYQADQALTELRGLLRTMRQEPGRIFRSPQPSEPFGR